LSIVARTARGQFLALVTRELFGTRRPPSCNGAHNHPRGCRAVRAADQALLVKYGFGRKRHA
jgi:hypothetical protein